MDKGEVKASTILSSKVTDVKWQMTAMRSIWDGTNNTMDLWINQTKLTSNSSDTKFFLEYKNYYKYLGAE